VPAGVLPNVTSQLIAGRTPLCEAQITPATARAAKRAEYIAAYGRRVVKVCLTAWIPQDAAP
jgi:hypothetical protein